MTIDDKIWDEKLQYDINREIAKISALSPRKIDKYEFLTGKEFLPSNQRTVIEQTKFAYCCKVKHLKTIKGLKIKEGKKSHSEEHGKQLVESNELVKKDFNIDRDSIPPEKQKTIFNEIVEERIFEFQNLKKIILTIDIWVQN